MPIEWEVLIAEMALLAGIIYGAIFVENFLEKRKLRRKEAEEARFFRLRGAFLSAKESATKLAEAYRGSEPGDRAAALLGKIEEDARAYEAEVAAREKERRDRVAGELDRLGMKALAALVRGK